MSRLGGLLSVYGTVTFLFNGKLPDKKDHARTAIHARWRGAPVRPGEAILRKVLRCYAEGRNGEWEAICLDLDIAVQEKSFEDVFHALNEVIALHVESVAALPETERAHLLDRPAPLSLRLRFLGYALRSLFTGDDGDGYHHQFTVPSAA